MAAKEEQSGLLSRVVKFVKNPTGWSALEPAEDGEALVSRQMLKEMIERKRRNDFVRKREFDMLRKMRRSDVMAGADYSTRPSFFQVSIPARTDDRAVTLKKIDDIEAQMSMQWWKTNRGDGAARPPGRGPDSGGASGDDALAGAAADAGSASQAPTAHAELSPSMLEFEFSTGFNTEEAGLLGPISRTDQISEGPTVAGEINFDTPGSSTVPVTLSGSGSSGVTPLEAAPLESQPTGNGNLQPIAGAENVDFSAPKTQAVVAEEFTHDPELEEASIRFANGDYAGAEAGLLEVLAPGAPRIDHDQTWLTLFDLYRATGEHERFETAAIDFAHRFGRSAPQWESFPEAVSRMNLPTSKSTAPETAAAHWTSPSNMGLQTVAAMNAALGRSPRPWRLSWAKLNVMDRAAIDGLKRAFTQWSSQPQALQFLAPEKLEKVLSDATPSGDATVEPGWWQLRMELMRLMHRPDEFEMIALDYCVTYEVSPPSWEKPACQFTPLQADGSPVSTPTIIGEAFSDSVHASGFADLGRLGTVRTVELAGEILGDAEEALATLDARLGSAESIVISCARLIRIDFSAAGMLLNWVADHAASGRQVHFTEVNRLVAAFFNVIAISEHARVTVRTD